MAIVDRRAPVVATDTAIIQAPLDLVWSIESDIAHWPDWNEEISSVRIKGPVRPGTEFRWRSRGLTIHSELTIVAPEEIAWVGGTIGISERQVWSFTESSDGVLVRTSESFSGWRARMLSWPMRRMRQRALRRGLLALKAESERRARLTTR
jgi:hypothetical protein